MILDIVEAVMASVNIHEVVGEDTHDALNSWRFHSKIRDYSDDPRYAPSDIEVGREVRLFRDWPGDNERARRYRMAHRAVQHLEEIHSDYLPILTGF